MIKGQDGVQLLCFIDSKTQMPSNSSVVGLVIVAAWLVFFYGANLTPDGWFGYFNFDSSELPIVTIYAFYIPIFVQFMRKEKNLNPLKRFVLPLLGLVGSVFMVFAAVFSHGYVYYIEGKEKGVFSCPVLFYLIIFTVIMFIGYCFANDGKDKTIRIKIE